MASAEQGSEHGGLERADEQQQAEAQERDDKPPERHVVDELQRQPEHGQREQSKRRHDGDGNEGPHCCPLDSARAPALLASRRPSASHCAACYCCGLPAGVCGIAQEAP